MSHEEQKSYLRVITEQMAPVLFTIRGTVMNELAFSVTYFLFSELMDNGKKEHKRHDFALDKLQRARDKWNKHRIEHLEFINKGPREKNEARTL